MQVNLKRLPILSGAGPILLTSQLPVAQWHAYIGEPTVADAILDRLVHSAHRIELREEIAAQGQGECEAGMALQRAFSRSPSAQ